MEQQGVRIQAERGSENLLNKFSQFNDFYSWNKPINPNGAVVLNLFNKKYSGLNSCEILFNNTQPVEFNSGNSNMQFSCENTGLYFFRYSFFKDDPDADINFTVKMFVNGINTADTTIKQNLFDSSGFENGLWNSYFGTVFLVAGQTLDFSFVCQSDTVGSKLYFDGLKLTFQDRNIDISNAFSEPLEKEFFDDLTGITLPSIPSGGSYKLTGQILGAVIGDFIQLSITPPFPIQNDFDKLSFSFPYVYDNVGNVRFNVINNSENSFIANPFNVKLKVIK